MNSVTLLNDFSIIQSTIYTHFKNTWTLQTISITLHSHRAMWQQAVEQ